jgi:hypothetical protein
MTRFAEELVQGATNPRRSSTRAFGMLLQMCICLIQIKAFAGLHEKRTGLPEK